MRFVIVFIKRTYLTSVHAVSCTQFLTRDVKRRLINRHPFIKAIIDIRQTTVLLPLHRTRYRQYAAVKRKGKDSVSLGFDPSVRPTCGRSWLCRVKTATICWPPATRTNIANGQPLPGPVRDRFKVGLGYWAIQLFSASSTSVLSHMLVRHIWLHKLQRENCLRF